MVLAKRLAEADVARFLHSEVLWIEAILSPEF